MALTLLLACALMAGLGATALAAYRTNWQGEALVDPAIPKPTVTVQGNVVYENGKPTGFYELALCVRSGYDYQKITPDGTEDVLTREEYAQKLAADPSIADQYEIHYYPFRTVGAEVNINTDILTAVHWDLQKVEYGTFDVGTQSYDINDGVYPRGVNIAESLKNSDLSEKEAFPNITTPDLINGHFSVALDVEGNTRMYNVEGMAEHYEDGTALITLAASAPNNYPIVFKDSTPVVVARFAYDLKRFATTKVNETFNDPLNSITGDSGDLGFWMGWDKTAGVTLNDNLQTKSPLAWLGESDRGDLYNFTKSDDMVSRSQNAQSVWVQMATNDLEDLTTLETYFYYYLGADDSYQNDGMKSYKVADGTDTKQVDNVLTPKTKGMTVLTKNPDPDDPALSTAEYTFFHNLLRLWDQTLVIEMVNQPSFKQPTGGYGGNQILFYDWDDRLIGSLIVGDGDVRADVEKYIEENLVHPDLRPGAVLGNLGGTLPDLSDPAQTPSGSDAEKYKNLVSSLDRTNTYRGKYAHVVGGDNSDPNLVDLNGTDYPLTNKLDYVFTKRVNTFITQTDPVNSAQTRYVHPYALNDTALADTDAALYPYTYGWAIVEQEKDNGKVADDGTSTGQWKVMHDADQIKDTWTTFGTGELDLMKRLDMSAAMSTLVPDSTTQWNAPSFLADPDPTWEDGSKGNDYLYKLADTSAYLRFADFSDITSEMERYDGKNVLIVKAVYEEGAALLDGYNYTVVTTPAYTKWNTVSAANGGAYKVTLTMERYNVYNNILYGTTRIREPVIQQDTTIDYKWSSDPEKGVDHDLDNATYNEAIVTKAQTLYTQVDADNGEQITFSLALSARQNKVQYILIENYLSNFVAGTQLSETNNTFKGQEKMFIPDNYNYLAENDPDADQTDPYYDCTFADKEGSYGFVLYCTLGHFMEQATLSNNGERNNFTTAVSYTTAQDANLRMDANGTQPEYANNSALRTIFLAAEQECRAHKNDPAYDCWDVNLDCAKLSYHQAQLYILNRTLLPKATADSTPISWCHYHASCVALVSGKPTSWSEVISAAQDPSKSDNIGDMLAGEIENITGLRKAGGAPFTSGTEFQNAVVAAVNAGCTSWVDVQYYIIHGEKAASSAAALAEALTDYWWYDGSTSAPGNLGSLSALVGATQDYFSEYTLKDGSKVKGWLSKLDAGSRNFDSNAEAEGDEISNGWKNMTENLVAVWHHDDPDGTESTDKFTSWAAFKAAFLPAVEKARAAGVMSAADDADYWWKVQYLILHPAESTWPASKPTEADGYWWHNGGKHLIIKDLQTMLTVAELVAQGDEAAADFWDANFTWSLFQSCSDMTDFKWSFDGKTAITAGTFDQFKTKIVDLAVFYENNTWVNLEPDNANLWKDVQFWLIHEESEMQSGIPATEYQYYWWEKGGTAEAITLEGRRGIVTSWLTAAFASAYNGNDHAWDNLTADAANSSNSLFNTTRLRKPEAEKVVEGSSDYPKLDDLPTVPADEVKTLMNALMEKAMAGKSGHATHTPPSGITWYQVQYYIITGNYVAEPTAEQTAQWEKEYWWISETENPNKSSTSTPGLDKPLWSFIKDNLLSDTAAGKVTAAKLKTAITTNDLAFVKTTSGTLFATSTISKAKTRLKSLIANASVATQGGVYTLTWYQIQYALTDDGDGAYLDPKTAFQNYKDTYTWAPDWVKSFYVVGNEWTPFDDDGNIKTVSLDDGVPVIDLAQLMGEAADEQAEQPSLDELLDMEKQLEQILEQVREQIAAAQEEAQETAETETPEVQIPATRPSTSTPSKTPEVDNAAGDDTTADNTPAEDNTTTRDRADNRNERPEIPQGEEAQWVDLGQPLAENARATLSISNLNQAEPLSLIRRIYYLKPRWQNYGHAA